MATQTTLDSNLALNPGLLPGKLTNPLPLPPSFSSPHPESPGKYLLLLFSHSVVSNSLWPHGLQHARLCCPSLSPWVCSNSCPLSQWCHPTISSSVTPFSSCPQSFPASGSFPMTQLFTSGGQSIGVSASASVLPMNTQDWSRLGWTGWMASLTQWTWVWVNSGSWWWTGRPGVLRFTGSQRVGHDWATELNCTKNEDNLWEGQRLLCLLAVWPRIMLLTSLSFSLLSIKNKESITYLARLLY